MHLIKLKYWTNIESMHTGLFFGFWIKTVFVFPVYGDQLYNLSCYDRSALKNDLPFCLMPDYNKQMLPVTNTAMDISVLVYLNDVIEVNDSESTVTLIMLLAVSWIDPRLKLINDSSSWTHDGRSASHSSTHWLNYIWRPDIDMLNVKQFRIRHIMDEQGNLT